MIRSRQSLTAAAALLVGLVLLGMALRHTDVASLARFIAGVWSALPLLLLPGVCWHLVRTAAWQCCFPAGSRPRFAATLRVRLAAEALSYLTISGVAGEPLKVLLLAPSTAPVVVTSAIAIERVAYLIVTAALLAVSATLAVATMPLTTTWVRVFSWIAGGAAVFTVASLVMLARVRRHRRAEPAVAVRPEPASRVRRFARELAREFGAFARSNPRTIAAVVGLEAAAFVTMVLEVYAVLAVTGHSISPLQSIAVETFTRVSSLVTAFIPANIGALEASNIAAAGAVRLAEGGIALALVRRVRGLLFCALGFLVYPRIGRQMSAHEAADSSGTLMAIQRGDSDALVAEPLGGLPVAERIARAAARAGYTRLLVWTEREAEWTRLVRRGGVPIVVAATNNLLVWQRLLETLDPVTPATVLAPGVVPSPPLLRAAQTVAIAGADIAEVPAGVGYPRSGVFRAKLIDLLSPERAADAMTRAIAQSDPPIDDIRHGHAVLSLSAGTPRALAASEQRLRDSIVKPTDGRLGRFNRRFSIPVSIALIRSCRLSAHAMSVLIIVLGLYAGWLFSRGTYGMAVAAALISWAASVLDGCDGELARLQYKESAFGCWVDTFGDYTYYLAVFAGLTVGAARQTGWSAVWWCGAALGVGLLITLTLLTLLRWRATEGRPERLRTQTRAHFLASGKRWARIVAYLSNCATRATMPYGILALALLGLAPVIVVLATIGAQIYWISLAKELGQLLRMSGAPRRAPPLAAD